MVNKKKVIEKLSSEGKKIIGLWDEIKKSLDYDFANVYTSEISHELWKMHRSSSRINHLLKKYHEYWQNEPELYKKEISGLNKLIEDLDKISEGDKKEIIPLIHKDMEKFVYNLEEIKKQWQAEILRLTDPKKYANKFDEKKYYMLGYQTGYKKTQGSINITLRMFGPLGIVDETLTLIHQSVGILKSAQTFNKWTADGKIVIAEREGVAFGILICIYEELIFSEKWHFIGNNMDNMNNILSSLKLFKNICDRLDNALVYILKSKLQEFLSKKKNDLDKTQTEFLEESIKIFS